MSSIQRAISRLTLKPSAESNPDQRPYCNEDNFIEFTEGGVENPRNWSLARKRCITAITVFLSVNGTIASSITTGTTQSISEEFGVSSVAAQLTTSLFLLGFCAGPLIFGPLSEFYGRRWLLYITFFLYFCFTYLTAWPPNFGGLLIGRFLAGSFAAGPFVIGPAVLVDLWDKCKCGNAMGISICAYWVGPALGTVISGACELKKNWHWSMYACIWLASFTMMLMFAIPETHSPTILVQKAKLARKQGHDIQAAAEASRPKLLQLYKTALIRPWVLLFDTVSFLCCLYSCVVSALQYMLFSIYPIVFQDMRGWNAAVSQLPVLGQAVGAVIGLSIVFDHTRRRKIKADTGREIVPEDHMVLAMIGGVGFPICMVWLCWSAQYNSVHWIVPTAGGTMLATCLMLIHVSCYSYITDTYADYAASVIAVSIVARSVSSAAAPLFTRQMFNATGVGGGGSLIAGVAALLAITPFLFYRFGHRIRSNSKYAPS
ncbi:major facilitator superfamily transporter [Fusarium beomiforme]|uniref:Major facilitator superfamily transporter n=1 Tax=Fusarium beomiforme TaxID=44412 RepID=A0A9P5AGL7_9HYPO|nr:major facilitator superfamily transporter [Fusarium beomiforme]